ncbi:glycosyltransferase [Dyadobacter sp. 3J3]|uniref:glycosyltransferase n=1 Tax=Dyadobacter sp. 3J3 TaxID=2606600 RepID=UPI00135BB889|nr:glycosyltransferase [Dyadobacter sp. 3J3]
MKIFHVITLADLGGAQSVVINLANESIQDGHDVIVVSEQDGPMWEVLDERVVKIRIPELQRAVSPVKEILVVQKLKQLYRQFEPDVVHLHSSKVGILGRLAFPSKKIVYTIHGFDSIRLAYKIFLPLEKVLKNRAKFIVAVSHYDLKNLKQEGIEDNAVNIYNGITDWPNLQKTDEIDLTFERLKKIKESCFVVLSIARLSKPKRFDLFCELAESCEHKRNIKFVWIGNSYTPQNIPPNVICLGEIKNAHIYLPLCDVFLLASDYEGMPMSILEAMAYEKPVLASNVGGISEVLDGTNGFAIENTVSAFKEKILAFEDGSLHYHSFSKAARKSFEDKFTATVMYQNYRELYNILIAEVLK